LGRYCFQSIHPNNPIWQSYGPEFFRISNGKKSTTEKSWYHPINFGWYPQTSNWNGRITLWDDTFVILFNNNPKSRGRAVRIAKVVASMLDSDGTGSINDPALQQKLFNAQAHILLGCENGCNKISDSIAYKTIMEKLGKCSGEAACNTWNALYHMQIPSELDDLKRLEQIIRSVINGFVNSAAAYTASETPSFFSHMALTSMTVDDHCEEVDCQKTNLIGLRQMVIDGRFNNDADCQDAMVQFGWGNFENLACTESDLMSLGQNDLIQAAKNGVQLGKPNEKYCKEPIYAPKA
jgi:hypothetical protein